MWFTRKEEGKLTRARYGERRESFAKSLTPSLALAACLLFVVTPNSRAQGPDDPPLPVDPTPLRQLISEAEKATLAEPNPKKLIDAYLKISDTHLQAAFSLIKGNNDRAAERELDIYRKAVAGAGKEAFALQDGKRTVSKRIEQVLYRQIKTLETIERLFSAEREMFATAALKHAKQLRVQALNEAFASGDVLKDPDEKKPKSEPPLKHDQPEDKPDRPPKPREQSLQSVVEFFSSSLINSSVARFRSSSNVSPTASRSFNLGIESSQISGDYLTEEEDEHVREAQAPDARVKVFMRIADRRLKALSGPVAAPTDKKELKKIEEEEREWGAVPKVSRTELLRHYARAISECMAKLEDAYERNPKNSALPKALTLLRDATDKHLQALNSLKADLKAESEVSAMSGAIYEAETANKGARDGLK